MFTSKSKTLLTGLFILASVTLSATSQAGPYGKKAKNIADTNDDGKVSKKEGRQFHNNVPGYGNNTKKVDKKWERIADTNHDGVVSRHEAKIYYQTSPNLGKNDRSVDKNWEVVADTNQDGEISNAEAKAYHKSHF